MKMSLIYIASSGLSRMFGFIIALLLGFYFSPAAYAKIGYFMALFGFSSAISGFATIPAFAKQFYEETYENILLILIWIVGISLILGTIFSAFLFFLNYSGYYIIAIYSGIFFFLFQFVQLEYRIKLKPLFYVINELIRGLLLFLIFFSLSYIFGFHIQFYFYAFLLSILLPALPFICKVLIFFWQKKLAIPQRLKEVLTTGLLILPTVFFSSFVNFSGRFFLGYTTDKSAVGVYSFCCIFGQIVAALSDALFNAYQPVFYKYNQSDPALTRRHFFYSMLLMGGFSLGLYLFLYVCSPYFPQEYALYLQDKTVLLMIIMGFALRSIYQFQNLYFILVCRSYYITAAGFIGFMASLIASVLIIPTWGARGAAICLFIGFFITSASSMLFYYAVKPRGLNKLQEF